MLPAKKPDWQQSQETRRLPQVHLRMWTDSRLQSLHLTQCLSCRLKRLLRPAFRTRR